MRKTLFLMLLAVLGFFGLTGESRAAKAYIADSFEITLRTGPSNENKIIAMLFSGRPVDVIGIQGEWSHVKMLDGDKEGWVMTRYLITRMPWEAQARKLQEDLAGVNAKLTRVQKEFADESQQRLELETELKRKNRELEALSKEFQELKKGAEGYMGLKTLHEAAEKKMEATQAELNRLIAENENLRSSEQNRWFLTGALVLLCGLLIGGIVGRQQKKRKSIYS